ncbi:hypothetical protein HOT49_gp086 [Erwinia phage vB_EamM_Alexandra]|uniref:Uncharacterized protein n=1 Tax=Erwinia phage vB_EamM_Alexandra TaxID=2201424 RepID=A0A2Z4QED3_9CAUD|nr:hypothetical protein HOT49_gp086 [Erwinia phage vB_EamM_Alexandra]AWY08598.1 hypothetical protein Alexandra_86 [Erwinia phage vB_EamM_Alexandra]
MMLSALWLTLLWIHRGCLTLLSRSTQVLFRAVAVLSLLNLLVQSRSLLAQQSLTLRGQTKRKHCLV